MISAEKFLETMVEKARMDPREIRAELKNLPTDGLIKLLRFCQERAGRDLPRRNYGLVHQDIVNILGEWLGFTVEFGDYEKGPDGVWTHGATKIVVESKTSSAWLQIRQVHDYVIERNASSGLAIAPEFTDDNLMAARSYGDVRLLTTDGLGRLLELKEEGRLTTEALVKILVPVESVKLDYFIDIIHAIAKPSEAPKPAEKPIEKPVGEGVMAPPLPVSRMKGFWPLPGGATSYVDTLFKILRRVRDEPSYSRLREWFIREYKLKGGQASNGYLNVAISALGLIQKKNDKLILTEEAKNFLETRDRSIVFNILYSRIFGIREIMHALREREAMSASELDEYMKRFPETSRWKTKAQLIWRINWLRSLGCIDEKAGKIYLTEDGKHMLQSIEK